ncbi:MAG TPA: hypothetical protein VGX75_09095, partial [bacterium]|nr:hypothetical protein [bacterium]
MRIFDVHVHYPWWDAGKEGFVDRLREVCEDAGVTKVAMIGRRGQGNDEVQEMFERQPDLIIGLA